MINLCVETFKIFKIFKLNTYFNIYFWKKNLRIMAKLYYFWFFFELSPVFYLLYYLNKFLINQFLVLHFSDLPNLVIYMHGEYVFILFFTQNESDLVLLSSSWFPASNYIFKVNKVRNMFKVNNNDTRTTPVA